MPRSPVTATQPPGTTPQVPNTVISSAVWNAALDDIYQIFNTPQPIAYGGTGATTSVGGADALSPAFVNVASAATTNIGAASSPNVNVTGTTTITAFDSFAAAAKRLVKFTGILTLTHNATSLILPGGSNITTAPGDFALFVSQGSGNWECAGYMKADGTAIVAPPTITAATQADQETATSTTTYVSPGRQQFHPSALKAWVKFDASGVIQASYNVTSVTDGGIGLASVTIATDFSSVNYSITCSNNDAASTDQLRATNIYGQSAGSFDLKTVNHVPTKIDPIFWYAQAAGDQ